MTGTAPRPSQREHEEGTLADRWRRWHENRPDGQVVHLDTAAAGRCSTATLRAAAAHADREAIAGAYVAEAEARPVLEAGRASLAGLLGMPASGLAFTESASAARERLLAAWPVRAGDTVAVVPSEWGPNLSSFTSRSLQITELAVHDDGTLDLSQLERVLATAPPAVVHLTQVASHRGLVQPAAQAAALCRAAGVALWVDAAQALGHVDTACGADAIYATSRKWLAGPRGVGMLAVRAAWWDRLHVQASELARASLPDDASPVRLLESGEAHIAGRVGLCSAVREYLETGPADIWQRLGELGSLARQLLSDIPGWDVIDCPDAGSAVTALRPRRGQDVHQTRARLLAEHRILTTASIPARAPREMTSPLLRVSPHVDCTPADLALLRQALAGVG